MKKEIKALKDYSIEKKLYEFLGIKAFRKLVLKIESIRHYKDSSKNLNYHIHGSGINSIQSFWGYLLYNASCHVISLALVMAYFTITWVADVRYIVIDIPMFILIFVNLYCIALQRYTYIKTQMFVNRRITVRDKRVADMMKLLSQRIDGKNNEELHEEFFLITRIQESIHNGTECFIGESDARVLRNIENEVHGLFKVKQRTKKNFVPGEPLGKLIENISMYPSVISKVEQRTAKLQNLFRFEKNTNVLFGFGVITENVDCENAYRELVSDASRDSVEFIFDVLLGAYDKTLFSLRGM